MLQNKKMNRNLVWGKPNMILQDSDKKEKRRARNKEQDRSDQDNYPGICRHAGESNEFS